MRRLIFGFVLIVLALLAMPARAQTSTSTALWTQTNTLADSQTYVYSLKDGTATAVAISGVTCSQSGAVPPVVTCQGGIPTPTPGAHSWVILATSADGTLQAASVAKVGTMPGAPGGIGIKVVVNIP